VDRRVKLLADQGVIFHTNFEVGRDATLADLRARHDAVLIATGVYKARDLDAPGSELGNIIPALKYLTVSNRQGLGDAVPDYDSGALNAAGKNVVVIGGGDTAMDCVRTAIRQGAKSVKCLYRRNRANMPGSQREVHNAEEEGVEFVWQSAPEAFEGKDGVVTGVRAHRIHLGVADASGRQTPQVIDGSGYVLEADLVIKALGFDPEDLPALFGEAGLKVSRWGTVTVNFRTMMSSLDGVFAAGDIVRGASLVVWAIRDGRDVAEHMHSYLLQKAEAGTTAAAVAAE
jgi:glutamate synthase (NADPH/NADH) small chain